MNANEKIMYNTFISHEANAEDVDLTKREREVLSFLVDGMSNKEIADAIGIKLPTVKIYVSSLLKKLHAENRTHAALRAYEMGIVKN